MAEDLPLCVVRAERVAVARLSEVELVQRCASFSRNLRVLVRGGQPLELADSFIVGWEAGAWFACKDVASGMGGTRAVG